MNYGLILTPVSLYQMTRGSLVLFVGALSVIFLRRQWLPVCAPMVITRPLIAKTDPPSFSHPNPGKLFLYQWLSLVGVMIGVALVGLSGTLKPKSEAGLTAEPANESQVFFGIIVIMFAQLFTATQVRTYLLLISLREKTSVSSYPFLACSLSSRRRSWAHIPSSLS